MFLIVKLPETGVKEICRMGGRSVQPNGRAVGNKWRSHRGWKAVITLFVVQ
jgi:hypothetical protein